MCIRDRRDQCFSRFNNLYIFNLFPTETVITWNGLITQTDFTPLLNYRFSILGKAVTRGGKKITNSKTIIETPTKGQISLNIFSSGTFPTAEIIWTQAPIGGVIKAIVILRVMTIPKCIGSVSYTHLDVYKRQS